MAEKEEFSLDLDKALVEQNGGWAGGIGDWIGAFGRSALESIPELAGITPSDQSLAWRNQNPGWGFVSELAGMALPYGGWLKAARGIKTLEAMATGVEAAKVGTTAGRAAFAEKALEAPFWTGARAEAVRLAPFEVSRVIASQAIGDQPFGDMAVGAGLNLVLGGGIAGVIGKLGASGAVAKGLSDVAPELDTTLPPQLILRELDKVIQTRPPDQVADLISARANLEAAARRETLPGKLYRYTDKSIDPKDELESFWRSTGRAGGAIEIKMPVVGDTIDTFKSNGEWQQIFAEAGIAPEQVARDLQFPRVVRANPHPEIDKTLGTNPDPVRTLEAARGVEKDIATNLTSVGDGWFMRRESNDGMFVMAKKVRGITGEVIPGKDRWIGQVKGRWTTWWDQAAIPPEAKNVKHKPLANKVTMKPGVDDTWVLFKTDKPGQFVKNSQGMMNASVARERWIAGQPGVDALLKDGGLAGEIARNVERFSFGHYNDMARTAKDDPSKIGELAERLWPKSLKGAGAIEAGKQFVREFLTPYDKQFGKNTRANWTANQGRLIQETVDSFYQNLLQGPLKFAGTRAALAKIVNVPGARSDLETLWTTASNEGVLDDIFKLRRLGVGGDAAEALAAKGEIHPRAAVLAKEIEDVLRLEHAEINKALTAAGQNPVPWRDGVFGLPRSWDGDYFQLVRNEAGDIVGAAAGGSPKAALREAEKLASEMSATSGVQHRVGEAFTRGQESAGLPSDVIPFLRTPGGTLGDKQIRGFKWDLETPDLPTILKEAHQYMQGRGRVLGTAMRDAMLTRHINALTAEDPHAAKMLVKRFNQMKGEEGDFARAQNRMTDALLSRFGFGSNTASKIAAATNTGITHLQLGGFKLTYPIQNIIGVLQTVMPEIAFVMNAPDAKMVQRYGQTWAAHGSRGSVGAISTLAPIKVMGEAMRMVMKPTAEEREFFNRMLNERVLDARVAEDFIGQNRRSLTEWKGALNSPKAFGEFILALSEWMPMHSERFARTLAAAAAYRTLKDWGRITDPDILAMQAKRFVERTNYLYSSADRPVVFTGPVGSSLGLFKNWQMNFIHTMAEYANMGVNRGVWSPLLWQTMSTAAIGGVAATPLFWVADGAANLFAQKKLVQLAYDEYGEGADGVVFGLPAALTGVSLSGLMSTPGANPVKDATQLFSFAGLTRMQGMGSAVKAAFDHWQATGQHPASDPDVRNNLAKAFAPVVWQRAMSLSNDQVLNLGTGLPTAKGLSLYDKMVYLSGGQPVGVARQMEASNILYQDREKRRAATTAFGDALSEAWLSNNSPLADGIQAKALALGLDLGDIYRSAGTRMKNQDKTAAERLSKPETYDKVRSLLGD